MIAQVLEQPGAYSMLTFRLNNGYIDMRQCTYDTHSSDELLWSFTYEQIASLYTFATRLYEHNVLRNTEKDEEK